MLLEVEALSKSFGETKAVADVTFSLAKGEALALLGQSGCGKTTTLRMINRLIEPTSGSVKLKGERADAVAANAWRRRIGYVVQTGGLFPHMSLSRNISVTPRLLGWSETRIADRVAGLMEMIGLPVAEYGERFPDALSGGQRQRIGVARALAAEPELLLMDEPFAALDTITKDALIDDMAALKGRLGFATIIVTHNLSEALRFADRIAVMDAGRIVQIGTPAELINAPSSDAVADLFQAPLRNARAVEAAFADLAAGRG